MKAAASVQHAISATDLVIEDDIILKDKLAASVEPDDASVVPVYVAPPTAEDEANFSAATRELVDLESPKRPAKTVHLPPEHVQEQRYRERKEALEEERRKSEADRPLRPSHLQMQAELASSPSSTVGAYSAATPLPPQESPDTSPDSEKAAEEIVPPPKDLQPSPEAQRAKDQHDRLLAAQKEIARKDAMGSEATPDDQLNWEAREAAAREAEEQSARQGISGLEADTTNVNEGTQAEEVIQEMQVDAAVQSLAGSQPSKNETPRSQVHDDGAASKQRAVDDDNDNITVTPRVRPTPIDTSRRQAESATATPRMTTRVSSGAMSRKSVSEIIGESPAPQSAASRLRRQDSTFEPISPMTGRPPVDVSPAIAPHTPPRPPRPSPYQTPQRSTLPAHELAALKGVAEDPDRDYLEPLFRIQAHDSPNSHTRALPELVKSAHKYLSTEDHFTTLHERMDYRILRRIYQLQNANKWSLRQMERVKEPEQAVTHLDHMMAEMKWMRKDFKSEHKMKTSVCAWLAARCADWVAADAAGRKALQIKVRSPTVKAPKLADEQPPDLDMAGESAPEDDNFPPTPKDGGVLCTSLIVEAELNEVVGKLEKAGTLGKALRTLPVVGLRFPDQQKPARPLTALSKFTEGKVLPQATGPTHKRSRYDYEDDAELLDREPAAKRLRDASELPPEDEEIALFHPDNKAIRDRLHANTAFRPPSEFNMPATTFYEFRNGSQWIWEDDQKLRKLAKEYSFNWSLIADEMKLPTQFKSAAERRTPWECFERWVELETLPAEMRKTIYFKTWFQRLEQSQQAAERRYQAQVAAIQAQAAQNGQGGQVHVPQRRRTVPSRVQKRKNTRYIWLVDAMRKLAKKREQTAFKTAEAQRNAAGRPKAPDNNVPPRQGPAPTPQELSKRRFEHDLKLAEVQRAQRQQMLQRHHEQLLQRARTVQQQGQPNGAPTQQRSSTANAPPQHPQMQANGQQQPQVNMNGQLPQQPRPALPMTTKNGHLAVPHVNAQGLPQAPMQQHGAQTAQQQQMLRIAQAQAQQRNGQYPQYPMVNGNMASPGSNMTTQQHLQHNQALLAQMSAAQQQQGHGLGQAAAVHVNGSGHQMSSASPSMPPPPTPQNQAQQQPGQLSSGLTPALIMIKNDLRAKNPQFTEDQLNTEATRRLQMQSKAQIQSTNQVRQSAMNAAAGISHHANTMHAQAYDQNQAANNGDGSASSPHANPQAAAAYANQVRARQMQQMQMMGRMQQQQQQQQQHSQSPSLAHAQLSVNGSPALAHVSPSMAPASPAMTYGVRPPSRNQTPGGGGGLQRMSSSGSVPGLNGMPGVGGMQSPGGTAMVQGSPRGMQASMAR
ncbi:hypothetical protein BAUCODRAFT_79827 [Baudoinia panamericana UAMH 10762]|uniref:Vacuolar import and degradation protein 21 n=1 Tax=Baudoinia panamericana (strain UAMH 10762) TaxID=717646 RepID=M2MYI3_BAUPA|nr:uncharacterized protein BAUCODRAFT_79827 [Baudoinia panamericana UAMH 10762]EMC91360.1 hypothetical protein BAUCODRAFT_79827 [Baudoinia panamericana UAMH 10762]